MSALDGQGRRRRDRLWRRIDREEAANYFEENVVAGRRQMRDLLLGWLEPVRSQRVLDLGCGSGATAALLARAGGQVTAVDCRPDFAAWSQRRGVRFVVGDIRHAITISETFSAVVLQEVLEDQSPSEQSSLLRALDQAPAERLLLVLRLQTGWHKWTPGVEAIANLPTVDPVPILRRVHLSTGYRLVRQKEIRRRNYRARAVEFRLFHDGAEV